MNKIESQLRIGAQIRILDEPFRGQLGACSGMNGYGVRVVLNLLGSQRPVSVSRHMVEPVSEGAESP